MLCNNEQNTLNKKSNYQSNLAFSVHKENANNYDKDDNDNNNKKCCASFPYASKHILFIIYYKKKDTCIKYKNHTLSMTYIKPLRAGNLVETTLASFRYIPCNNQD